MIDIDVTHVVKTPYGEVPVSIGADTYSPTVAAAAMAQEAMSDCTMTVVNLATGEETEVSPGDAKEWWA